MISQARPSAGTTKDKPSTGHPPNFKSRRLSGRVGSRMQLDFPTNKQGVWYAYFVSSGRASKRTNCTRRAFPVGVAELVVADCSKTITSEVVAALERA